MLKWRVARKQNLVEPLLVVVKFSTNPADDVLLFEADAIQRRLGGELAL